MKSSVLRTRSLSATLFLLAAAAGSFATQLAADTFGSGTNTFTMDFVNIGNAGNAADTTGAPNPAGSVPYTYRMGTYEVSRDMITKANNAGGLGITMSDMSSYGGNGGNRPATGVSWYEAAKFVNWLNTSTGHAPAYNFDGAGNFSSVVGRGCVDAWGPEPVSEQGRVLFSAERERVVQGGVLRRGGWGVLRLPDRQRHVRQRRWPAGRVPGPRCTIRARISGPADITNAGGLSPYGTMGQGGNVWEWMESAGTE